MKTITSQAQQPACCVNEPHLHMWTGSFAFDTGQAQGKCEDLWQRAGLHNYKLSETEPTSGVEVTAVAAKIGNAENVLIPFARCSNVVMCGSTGMPLPCRAFMFSIFATTAAAVALCHTATAPLK